MTIADLRTILKEYPDTDEVKVCIAGTKEDHRIIGVDMGLSENCIYLNI